MAQERLSNLGYFGFVKEATKGVPLTPTTFLPIYEETLATNTNFTDQAPIYGGKFMTYATLQGNRDHQGDITTIAEPNTTAYLMDMLYTRTSTTGSAPYTHTFGLSTTNPNSYTIDISTGNVVKRFWGVEASKLVPNWNGTELQHKLTVSALGSFQARTIATVSTTTITLTTAYDLNPTKGLVNGDLVRIYKASTGATLDTTITAVTDGITLTLGASAAAFAAGDIIHLRPATVTFALLPSFIWGKTQFKFGATASAAASATQTRIESGSVYELIHNFEKNTGADRSGGFDPAALVRLMGDANITVKKFFDTPEDLQNWNDLNKSALQISHFAGTTNQYEFRIVYNKLITDTPEPTLKANGITYSTIKYNTNYDPTDGAGVSVVVVNNIATI